jgi:succinate dehydrogenase hydrophobic anchor subunit
MQRRFQSYRGTWAWLSQRITALALVALIPLKIYTGWAALGKVPFPAFLGSGARIHINAGLDIALLLLFLVHAAYGVRVILIDIGLVREDTFFWRTLAAALGTFGLTVWFVYLRGH